jgi:hypothetical protein
VPADFPSYIVTPSEDLNPYDLSTMQKSTETNYRDGTGTLGTTVERQSNIEVNEALQKQRQERMKAAEEAKAKNLTAPENTEGEGAPSADEITPAEPPQLGDSAGDLDTPGVRGGAFHLDRRTGSTSRDERHRTSTDQVSGRGAREFKQHRIE